jgi:hypothetical protein
MHSTLVRTITSARTIDLAALACAALTVACASAESSATNVAARAQPLSVATLADATCTLHALSDPNGGLRLSSGHSGRATFSARRVAAPMQPAVMELDCRDAHGARDVQRLDLDTLLADGSNDAAHVDRGATRMRPALSGDLRQISQRELERSGYPRRPNVAPDSDAYRSWEESVSMPMRVLDFDGAHSELDFESNLPAGNWCGAVANSAPYEYAFGSWVEPNIAPSTGLPQYISAAWVGIGGGESGDTLIQAGTRQDYYAFLGIEMAVHQVFRQVWPQTDAHYCSDCTLQEGDRLQFSAHIDNADGNGGGTGVLYYWNVTQQEMAAVDIAFSDGFTGGTAEWVVEDPRQLGNGLPQFGSVTFDSMQTYSADTNYVDFGSGAYDTYAINVGSHDYCTTQVLSDTSIVVTRQPD